MTEDAAFHFLHRNWYHKSGEPPAGSARLHFPPGGQCPLPISSEVRQRGSPNIHSTRRGAASHKLLLPTIAPLIRYRAHNCVPANVSDSRTTQPARTGLKFRSSLFKGLRSPEAEPLVARRNGRNSPAFCFGKKEAWRKSPFLKGATFSILNRIREADTSLRTYKRTFIPTCKIGMQARHAS